MSGILAARFDDSPSDAFVERAMGTLAYRGHDGRGVTRADGTVVGRQVTWTTPQAVGETGPVAAAGVVVAFTGRLDARQTVADALPSGRAVAETSDARLVAHAYDEWGVAAFDRLLGAFAVAIHDPTADRLVCARDPTGLRDLFVARTGDGLVVASDARTVRTAPGVDATPSDRVLTAFLRREPGPDDATFYREVDRLPPGTRLVADDGGVRRERYWHPADGPSFAGESPDRLARRLRARLTAAVRDRLRSRSRVGVSLSGGLDSATIAGVAATCDAPTPAAHSIVFEQVPDEALTDDERGRIADTVERHGLSASEVVGDPHPPLSEPTTHGFDLREFPVIDPLRPATDRLHADVRDHGRRVLLSGTGGNALDGSRLAYADLLRRGRLVRLWRALARDDQPTRWLLTWFGVAPTVPGLAARLTDTSDPAWLGPRTAALDLGTLAATERFDRLHRRERYRRQAGLDRELSLHGSRRRAMANGCALRFPYRDARVLSLLYGVPGDVLFRGEPKALFRAAFGEVLPESVRQIRAGRAFGAFVVPDLRANADRLAAAGRDSRLEARGVLADGAYDDAVRRLHENGDDWSHAWYCYACERWLRRQRVASDDRFVD